MPIETRCPTCQTSYRLGDNQAGKRVRCRHCADTFLVQGPETGDDAPILQSDQNTSAEGIASCRTQSSSPADEDNDRKEPRRSKTKKGATERGSKPTKGSGNKALVISLVLGGVFLLTLLVGACVLVVTLAAPRENEAPRPQTRAQLPPIDVDDKGPAKVYLSDLKELNPRVGYGSFGKKGRLGYGIGGEANSPITVAGKQFSEAISTAPPHFGNASVQYPLGKRFKEFRAWIAVNDLDDADRKAPESPLTFKVLGDGKPLWTSAPLQQTETVQECRINVENVETLELQVLCPGVMHCARAVWLQPYLVK